MKALLDQHQRYKELRLIALVSLGMLILSNLGWALLHIQQLSAAGEGKVYVVSSRGSFPARLQQEGETTIYEARNHVEAFMRLMFSHDELSYGDHIEAAFHLIEKKEGAAIFEDFQKGQVHDNYIKYGSRSELEIDSIALDMQEEPYRGAVYGRQYVIYGKERKALPIGASFRLTKRPRNEKNPHGLLIQDWKFVLYENQFLGEKE
ncbi:MAG: hypothetical protein R8P61_33040 [Bacteroidia bacterium]|nr:hypothetical protein [Bacteroidia bacterium]